MAQWHIQFYADEYIELHLKPDEYEVSCNESELDYYIRKRIADRLGVELHRITFNPDNDEEILLDNERRGEVIVI